MHHRHRMKTSRIFFYTTVGPKVWARRGRKVIACKRGWQRQHSTAIVVVKGQGNSVPRALLWSKKKIRGDMFF